MPRSKAHHSSTVTRRPRRRQAPCDPAGIEDLLSPDTLLKVEQMFVNEALVRKIFECERSEAELAASEQRLTRLLITQFERREQELGRFAQELQRCLDQHMPPLCGQPDDAMLSIGRIIAAMHPVQSELGLIPAVELELHRFRQRSGLPYELSIDPRLNTLRLPERTAVALYRALQECLDNIHRHAFANRVDVTLDIADEAVRMQLSDDGIGFAAGTPSPPDAAGLLGVRLRLEALGGSVAVASSPLAGTLVTLAVPVGAAQADT